MLRHIFKKIKGVFSVLIATINHQTFKLIAFCISKLFPEKYWYKIVFFISYFSRFNTRQLVVKKKSLAIVRGYNINKLLALLTRKKRPFPIPYKIVQSEYTNNESGLILCTVHLPLAKVAIRAFLENNSKIDAAIVGVPTSDNHMAIWGITNKIPALVKSQFVLLKAKRILEQKGCIVLMIDSGSSNTYSPNILKLGGKIGVRTMFFFAELQPDGTIYSRFVNPPHPYCENEAAINANLDFLKNEATKIVGDYKKHPLF